jgi:hypothetical protein
MNHIRQFMRDHNLAFNERFAVVGPKKYYENDRIFFFNSNYRLVTEVNKWGKKRLYHSSILIGLLAGEYNISR